MAYRHLTKFSNLGEINLPHAEAVNHLLTDECRLEALRGVAAGAISAEFAAMHVLRLMAGITSGGQFGAGHVFGCVTGIAADLGMATGQRVMRITAMVKGHTAPPQGAVAGLAGFGETAFMLVISGMAGNAGCGRPLVNAALMAPFARGNHMLPDKRIVGESMIELHILLPGHGIVALAAIGAKAGFVDILLFVAGGAFHGNLGMHVSAMAIAAFGLFMGPQKREFGGFCMVEFIDGPFFNAVAISAFRAEFPGMHILNGVAVHAGGRQALVNLAHMAGNALGLGVFAAQLELGFVMVKGGQLLPSISAVAGFTFGAQIAHVGLLFTVAGIAA
jgi:hypothetical protein